MTTFIQSKVEKLINAFCLNGKITEQHAKEIEIVLTEALTETAHESRREAVDAERNRRIGIRAEITKRIIRELNFLPE